MGPHALQIKLPAAFGGHSIQVRAGASDLPRSSCDVRMVPAAFRLGPGFLAITTNVPGFDRAVRESGVKPRHPFEAPHGLFRALVAFALDVLEQGGHGVMLPRAGHLVLEKERFVALAGDPEDPRSIPFRAFIDVARSGVDTVRTFGMDLFGLPDSVTKTSEDSSWSRRRAMEVVMFAAYTMVRTNGTLEAEQTLEVPIGAEIADREVQEVRTECVSLRA